MDFHSYIGQSDIKNQLAISVQAAKANKKALQHSLFLGPPGLGKTSLSEIIIKEMGYSSISINPLLIKNVASLYNILIGMKNQTILFIDEIHQLNRECQEVLYSLMQDSNITYMANGKSLVIPYKDITVIGATTEEHLLAKPLVDRFVYKFYFQFYSVSELTDILRLSAKSLGFGIAEDLETVFLQIAECSKGTPRIAKSLLKLAYDDYTCSKSTNMQKVLQRNHIYPGGLDRVDIKMLETLQKFSFPIGISALATMVLQKPETISERESFMLTAGYIDRTPRGRILTEKGYKYLNSIKKEVTV